MKQLGPTDSEREQQMSLFNAVAEHLPHLYPNPNQQDTIPPAIEMLRWIYFGQENESLPVGLIKVMDDTTKTIEVEMDERVIHKDDFFTIKRSFDTGDDKKATEVLLSSEDGPFTEVLHSEIEELIQQAEGYQLILSFAAAPPHPPGLRPLSPTERVVRESQIDTDTRQRFGIDPKDRIPTRSPADLALRKALYHLDDEHVKDTDKEDHPTTEALAKVRRYFRPILVEKLKEEAIRQRELGKQNVDLEITDVIFSSGTAGFISDKADEDSIPSPPSLDTSGFLEEWYDTTLRQPGSYNLKSLEISFMEEFLETIYRPDLPQETFQQYVNDALGRIRDYAYDLLREGMPPRYRENHFEVLTRHAFIKQPQGYPILRSQYEQQVKKQACLSKENVQLYDKEEYREQEAIVVGSILFFGGREYSPPRLIQAGPLLSDLPLYSDEEHIVIKFESEFEETTPYIPGYITASHDSTSNRWGFVEDPNGDPYALADMPLPSQHIDKLVTEYDDIELHGLANDISALHSPTVADLVAAIKNYTTYFVPEKRVRIVGYEKHVDTLTGFKSDISDGQLRLQCTGSAKFLQLSLETLFDGHTSLQEGFVLSNWNNTINAVGHRQVAMEYAGKTYILDATGSITGAEQGIVANFIDQRTQKTNPRPPARIPKPHDSPSAMESPPTLDINYEKSKGVRSNFEQQLLNVFGFQSTSQLYDHLAPLPEYDPLRRTLGALMKPSPSSRQLQATEHYLDLIMQADETTLRKTELLHYKDNQTLSMAKNAIQKILAVKSQV